MPENVVYNHHHGSVLVGGDAMLEEITLTGPDDPQIVEHGLGDAGHHMPFTPGSAHYVVRNKNDIGSVPNNCKLGAANGG